MFKRWLRNRRIARLRQSEQDLLDFIEQERWRKDDADRNILEYRRRLSEITRDLVRLGTPGTHLRRPMATRVTAAASRSKHCARMLAGELRAIGQELAS